MWVLPLSLSLPIYIYMYICVRVCVCCGRWSLCRYDIAADDGVNVCSVAVVVVNTAVGVRRFDYLPVCLSARLLA